MEPQIIPIYNTSSLSPSTQDIPDASNQQIISKFQRLASQLVFHNIDFTIVCQEIQYEQSDLLIKCFAITPNGCPLVIKPPFHTEFEEMTNFENSNVKLSLQKSTNSVQIEMVMFGYFDKSTQEIKFGFNTQIVQGCNLLTRALCTLGKIRKFSKHQMQLKEEQLHLRKQVLSIIIKNKPIISFKELTNKQPAFCKVQRLQQLQRPNDTQKSKQGGYCTVQPVRCLIQKQSDHETFEQVLAVKRPLDSLSTNLTNKISRELELIKQIRNSEYTCQYYHNGKSPHIYMSYAKKSLRDLISRDKRSNIMGMQMTMQLCMKIIAGVKTLHESGIVHRDLKPQNILLSQTEEGYKINIIDFGESVRSKDRMQDCKVSLGSTFPYSPMECLLGIEKGFNKFQIDLWSINMILYELVFRCLPISYNKSISVEIIEDWFKSPQFTTYQSYRKRRGLSGSAEIISLISILGLKTEQRERLSIEQLESVFSSIQKYYKNCMNLY